MVLLMVMGSELTLSQVSLRKDSNNLGKNPEWSHLEHTSTLKSRGPVARLAVAFSSPLEKGRVDRTYKVSVIREEVQ